MTLAFLVSQRAAFRADGSTRTGFPAPGNSLSFVVLLSSSVVLLFSGGCTSPLTGLALKEFLRESTASVRAEYESDPDESAEIVIDDDDAGASTIDDAVAQNATADMGEKDRAAIESADEESSDSRQLEASISRSLERFARAPMADAAAQAILVETLEKAAREDWPEIIDSFSISLESAAAESPNTVPDRAAAAPGGLTRPVDAVALSTAEPSAAETDEPSAEPSNARTVLSPSSETDPVSKKDAPMRAADGSVPPSVGAMDDKRSAPTPTTAAQPSPEEIVASLRRSLAEARLRAPLVIANPCFASRVRGWAAVDRFPESRFSPGQQVIVYLELENLVAAEDPSGATTRIDTAFRLTDANGQLVHEWTFPTVEDHSANPRTDFFARYFLTMPESASVGRHQLEMVVTDRIAGKDAKSSLGLDIRPVTGDESR